MTRVLVLCAALVGCGSSDSNTNDAGSGRDAGIQVPAESCAQPGDTGNEIGVGTFCTPTGNECTESAQARLCLAAVARDEGQWFCTRLCTTDDQCGSDAVCVGDPRGRACVPARCAPDDEDAGVTEDAGTGS